MNVQRSDRIASQVKNITGELLLTHMGDPIFKIVTITVVKMSPDLKYAKIYYSVLGDEKQKKAVTNALKKAQGHIRAEIGHKLSLRVVPEISFFYDETEDYADHINKLLKKIKSGPEFEQ